MNIILSPEFTESRKGLNCPLTMKCRSGLSEGEALNGSPSNFGCSVSDQPCCIDRTDAITSRPFTQPGSLSYRLERTCEPLETRQLRARSDLHAHLPNREIPKLVPFRSSTELYLLSFPVMIALRCIVSKNSAEDVANRAHHRNGLAIYRPTSLYDVCPFASPAINASVKATFTISRARAKIMKTQRLTSPDRKPFPNSPIQTSISPFFNFTCISPVPPGHSTSSKVFPWSLSANRRRGERKCSRCQPTRSFADIARVYFLMLVENIVLAGDVAGTISDLLGKIG